MAGSIESRKIKDVDSVGENGIICCGFNSEQGAHMCYNRIGRISKYFDKRYFKQKEISGIRLF